MRHRFSSNWGKAWYSQEKQRKRIKAPAPTDDIDKISCHQRWMGENPIIMAPASWSGQTEVGDAGQDIDK
jgi:hypothetical protein